MDAIVASATFAALQLAHREATAITTETVKRLSLLCCNSVTRVRRRAHARASLPQIYLNPFYCHLSVFALHCLREAVFDSLSLDSLMQSPGSSCSSRPARPSLGDGIGDCDRVCCVSLCPATDRNYAEAGGAGDEGPARCCFRLFCSQYFAASASPSLLETHPSQQASACQINSHAA